MNKRILSGVVAMTLLPSLLLTGCGPKKVDPNAEASSTPDAAQETGEILTELTSPVEIEVWHTYSDSYETWFQEVTDKFNETHENIHVTLQLQPGDQYEAKVMAAAKSGTLPNIIRSQAVNMTTYASQDMLVDLNDYIYNEEVGYPNFDEDINPGLATLYDQWDGARYAIPLFMGGNVFFYNKTMFDELGLEPPTKWSEVEAVATAVSEKIGKPGFGFQVMVDGFMEMLIQDGGQVVDVETNTVEFDSDIAKDRIAWYQDLLDKGVARLVGDDKHFTNPFANGDVGCYVALSGNLGYLTQAVGDKFELGVAPLPQEGPVQFVSLSEPIFAITKSTPEEELASWIFLNYLLSPEVNADCASVFGGLPATESAINTDLYQQFLQENPVAQAVLAEKDAFGYVPAIDGFYDVRTSLDRALEEIFLGISDPDTALATAKTTAQQAID